MFALNPVVIAVCFGLGLAGCSSGSSKLRVPDGAIRVPVNRNPPRTVGQKPELPLSIAPTTPGMSASSAVGAGS